MVESHFQPTSVRSEPGVETGPPTQSVTILGTRFNVQSPYSVGHVCTRGEARALNRKRLESIRNHLAAMAKNGALTQADVDAYAVSYVFGGAHYQAPASRSGGACTGAATRSEEGAIQEGEYPGRSETAPKRKGSRNPSSKLQSKSRS